MLTDAKKKELLVLYTIVQSNDCSLHELSQMLVTPKRTIKEIIRKLNEIIFQNLEIEKFIYSTPKGEIKLDPYHEDKKMTIFYYIKLFFLRESNRFNFLVLLFDSPNTSVSKKFLLEQLYISSSYLEKMKILKQAKDFTGELKNQLTDILPKKFAQNEVLYFNFLLCYFFSKSHF